MSAEHGSSGLTSELLGALRARHLGTNLARVATLDLAARAQEAGTLDAELHAAAARDAHKLAGTLGSLGLDGGTALARRAESMLESGAPDARALAVLAEGLRQLLQGVSSPLADQPEPEAGREQDAFETLAALWRPERAANLTRLDAIEQAVVALLRGDLADEERARARTEAGDLARSLSRFGYASSSHRAGSLASLLADVAADGWTVSKRLVELRSELESAGLHDDGDGPVQQAAPVDGARAGTSTARRVLLVSSDPVLSRALAVSAVRAGIDLFVLAGTKAAQKELAARGCDACVLDLDRADGAGLEGLERLAAAATPAPVVVLTGRDTFEDRLAAARRGAQCFLPRSLSDGQVIDAVAQMLPPAGGERSTVLAVDDDPIVLETLGALLDGPEFELVQLDDPRRLWTTLESTRPDLLIVDVDMPEVSGLELSKVVRADPSRRRLPILLLTSRRDPETMRSAFAIGIDDYVLKPIVGSELRARIDAHLERSRLLRAIVEVDPLTGVASRWKVQQAIGYLLRLAARRGEPLAFAVLDIDRFKQVNDCHGHIAGDMVLRRFGELLRGSFRAEDATGRWSGDEFVVGMYGATLAAALERIARLLELVRSERFQAGESDQFAITCSAGIAEFPVDGDTVESLFGAADAALYAAKDRRGSVAATRRPAADAESRDGAAADEVDVLLVEDDEAITDVLRFALETRGYRVAHCANGAKAAAELVEARTLARVVLLDVGLPGLDGFGVLRRLRERGLLDRMHVIVLTARAGETEVLRALELGAFDHIAKPFSVPVLLQRIQRALTAAR